MDKESKNVKCSTAADGTRSKMEHRMGKNQSKSIRIFHWKRSARLFPDLMDSLENSKLSIFPSFSTERVPSSTFRYSSHPTTNSDIWWMIWNNICSIRNFSMLSIIKHSRAGVSIGTSTASTIDSNIEVVIVKDENHKWRDGRMEKRRVEKKGQVTLESTQNWGILSDEIRGVGNWHPNMDLMRSR